MGILSALKKLLTSWYVIAPAMAGLGVAAGLLIFLYAVPGTPKIGVIDVPFTVITEESAYIISQYLNHARRDDSIKAVVIRLSSPGGGAASSERLYVETRQLRQEKPVVLVINGMAASGGYMMAMGATHTYTQTSSLVGNVGVITFSGPLIPPLPGEELVISGPHKLDGSTRREWIGTVETLTAAFAQIVITERGNKLRISEDELTKGRIYSGLDAVRLGLADEIGGDSHAFQKAAELAGISRYSLVDVNLEVLREIIQNLNDILPSSDAQAAAAALSQSPPAAQHSSVYNGENPANQTLTGESGGSLTRLQALRGLMLYGRLGAAPENPLPDFPMDINRPNLYYLYVGNAP